MFFSNEVQRKCTFWECEVAYFANSRDHNMRRNLVFDLSIVNSNRHLQHHDRTMIPLAYDLRTIFAD